MTDLSRTTPLTVAVIGCGRWGPNHVRVFNELDSAKVVAVADPNLQRLQRIRKRYPSVRITADYHNLLDDPDIAAVVIATPTDTHAVIATEALQAGKHVLVEKPIAATVAEARELAELADELDQVLMVGHVFLFNTGINRLRDYITSGELGRLCYLDAVRTNLGPIRPDVNALFDLATHDISIFNYLVGASPVAVSALGRCITQREREDVCFATLRYGDGALGHIHVSWLNPRKVRTLTVVGQQRMAHWDDVDPAEALRVYDKGLDELPHYDSFGEFQYLLRSADVHLPAVRRTEPLGNQAQAFTRWVLNGVAAPASACDGLAVVEVLEAAARSMQQGGAYCPVEQSAPVALPVG